jgi:hypothetical protein
MKLTLALTLLSLLFVGCTSSNSVPPEYRTQVPTIVEKPPVVKAINPKYKKHKMQEVDEKNFSDNYMYPEDGKLAKKDPIKKAIPKMENNTTIVPKTPIASHGMSKSECISMMGEDKFEHYSKMFGGDAGAIKRCAMIKGMQ